MIYWLEKRGIQPTEAGVEKIFARAKLADRLLTDAEILELCGPPAAASTPRGEGRKGHTGRRGDSPHKPRPE